jgi:CHAT domain-containing protein
VRGILKHALRLVAVLTALVVPARAEVDPRDVEELTSASRVILEGRVSEGIDRLTILLRRIDPAKDSTTYWRTGETLVSFLSQTENHAAARAVLNHLLSTKLPEANAPWVHYYLGRSLAYLGMADEGEKLLRALTGGDARLVHSPVQRAAAVMLSTIELDRNNVGQSAIWMRRAVIGTFVDKRAGAGEIIDVLTQYAAFLAKTRRLAEAHSLFAKLGPIYGAQFPHRSPAYLNFVSSFLDMLESAGNFKAADALHNVLNESAPAVDVPATSIREQLFFLDLYKDARAPSEHKKASIPDRLKQVVADYPDFLKQSRNRIVFSYLALLAGNVEVAEQFISSSQGGEPLDAKFAAYEVGLRSFIAARHGKFSESIALSREALEKVLVFHQRFENESSSRLPAFTVDERLVLGLIVGVNAAHVSSFDEADALFQLQQFLSRDKGKLGLNTKIARQRLTSDLQREDARTRDRLQELRDRLMREAVDGLLARVLPIREYAPAEKQDYAFLIRLEEIEDKISNADEQLRHGAEDFLRQSADVPVSLPAILRLVKYNEALVMHLVAGPSLVTACINSDSWTFHVKAFDQAELQQGIVDQKLLVSAVQGAHPPSAALDSSFPSDSSHRVYRMLFGGVEACLRGKTHLLLAPDPDFFALPWNALLTSPPSGDKEFRHREASWLPRSYALSLLPSVRSLYQLRADLPPSRAREMFLGIGAPDFKGTPEHSTQLSLASLFATRGVGNRTAIAQLPPLPSAADELRTIAETLRTSASDLLLGGQATERELRKRPLNDYRVISFATHALVAGEIDGITEPALALAPGPDERNQGNDGLLTATEVANLALDANLVILSACNTAAPDGGPWPQRIGRRLLLCRRPRAGGHPMGRVLGCRQANRRRFDLALCVGLRWCRRRPAPDHGALHHVGQGRLPRASAVLGRLHRRRRRCRHSVGADAGDPASRRHDRCGVAARPARRPRRRIDRARQDRELDLRARCSAAACRREARGELSRTYTRGQAR